MSTIRKEGCNELVAVQLVCTGGTPTPAGQPVPLGDLTFEANVQIGSEPGAPEYPGTMIVDQPSKFNLGQSQPLSGSSYSGPPITGVGGPGVNYSDGSVPNLFQGQFDGAYSVKFTGIPLDPSPNGRTITLQFWIRACDEYSSSQAVNDAFMFFIIGATPKPLADRTAPEVSRDAAVTYTVTGSPLDLGPDLDCFVYRFDSGSAPGNNDLNASLLGSAPSLPSAASATLHHFALFPDCLRVRATGYQDDVTQFYNTDLGFTAPGFPSPFANYGTELQAVFNNIPGGVSVFVQNAVTGPLGTVMLTSPGTPAGSTGLTQLPVNNGSATAIWETQTASTTQTGSFDIPLYFAYQSGVTSPANITVVQSLGSPPGGVQFVQPPANLIQPVLFSINTGASTAPILTATLDSRLCILGVTFWTNNACSPGSGPFVTVTSDSASIPLNFATVSTGGLTGLPLVYSSLTPSLVQLFPKAANASPGIYQDTLNITAAQGSTSPVSVPLTVSVLPPNNPVFELNAVFDAFSYQSKTIAPGQIFTIFGSNFGPASLVLGTLGSSRKLTTTVVNTQVLFDGIAAPLLYVVNGQLSGVAPFELTGKTSTNVQLVYNGLQSPVVAVPVQAASISIASADGTGGNGAVVLNKDGKLNTPSNPASVGDTVVIYASYAGPFANGVTGTDGRTTTGPPYPAPAGTPSVTMGGVPATKIPYFGNAPTLLESVMQINVVIPAGVPSSPYDQLVISAGGVTSPPWTTIAVQ